MAWRMHDTANVWVGALRFWWVVGLVFCFLWFVLEFGSQETSIRAFLKGIGMQKYECTACGYVYDPAGGDPENRIDPGTAFEDLPDDWVCPECGVPKDEFEPVD